MRCDKKYKLSEENHAEYDMFMKNEHWGMHLNDYNIGERWNEFQSQAISDWPKIMKTEKNENVMKYMYRKSTSIRHFEQCNQ